MPPTRAFRTRYAFHDRCWLPPRRLQRPPLPLPAIAAATFAADISADIDIALFSFIAAIFEDAICAPAAKLRHVVAEAPLFVFFRSDATAVAPPRRRLRRVFFLRRRAATAVRRCSNMPGSCERR